MISRLYLPIQEMMRGYELRQETFVCIREYIYCMEWKTNLNICPVLASNSLRQIKQGIVIEEGKV